jgi:hypothetical protein
MTDFTNARLIYRASRDSFSGEVYHRLLSVQNTVTVIKSNLNYVFGGYTSISLNKSIGVYTDPTAFIFSLRRNGTINNIQLRSGGTSYDPTAHYALSVSSGFGAFFGNGDLVVCDQSFSTANSYSGLCATYDCPVGCSFSTDCSQSFLAGTYIAWYTDEIEVFQMLSPVTTTVQPGQPFYLLLNFFIIFY